MEKTLADKKCVACEGGVPPLKLKEVDEYMKELSAGWEMQDGHLVKEWKFKDFKETMRFVNSVADLAESEGHHPDFFVSYGKLKIELWTHAISGLSENDFILAAKIDALKM